MAYRLEAIGEPLWVLSVLAVILGVLAFVILGFTSSWGYWWIPLLPMATAVIAMFMRGHSESMFADRGYRYDYEADKGFEHDIDITP